MRTCSGCGAGDQPESRLAPEFEKNVDGLTMSTRRHSGRCVGYGEGMAFLALAQDEAEALLRSALAVTRFGDAVRSARG